jgi:tRNA pseudouridine55 synthase
MLGFLNIDKPAAITSRDAVNRIQRIVRPSKVGHAGTLDPLATGVLVVALGGATRLVDYVHRFPKTYEAAFLLGRQSDTEDITGQVMETPADRVPGLEELQAAMRQLVGQTMQRPPAYSALKVQGERAYDLARRGESVALNARPIRVHEIELLRYDYPELQLRIKCGTGTYVRSLGRDLAESVGTHAVMSQLRRTAIGVFHLRDAVPLETIGNTTLPANLQPPECIFDKSEMELLSVMEQVRIMQGQWIERASHGRQSHVAALDQDGKLLALLVPLDANRLRPVLTLRHER